MYAIIDLESTGGKFNEEGITEIAVYRHDGQQVVDQFACLVNPERKIQPFVVKLTGINNAMLRYAPKFHEVAKRIIEITEDCVIVAHNAKFDYRLLRTEFKRLGYDYQKKTICTIELSKYLIPGMPSYSLGKLVKSLGIPLVNRHRAIGDAQATVRLFELLLTKDTDKQIVQKAIRRKPQSNSKKNLLQIVDTLPTEVGIYYIHDHHGKVIYIGKSKNINRRVNQHFTKDNPQSKQIQQAVVSVSYDLTGNELFAKLIENEEIKKVEPKLNRVSEQDIFTHGLYQFTNKKGYINLKLKKITRDKPAIISFKNRAQGKEFIERLIDEYQLCQKYVGLYNSKNACFNYGIKKCRGACIEKEPNKIYNKRVLAALDQYSFQDKTFLLVGPGRKPSEKSALLVENGIFKGIAYYDLNYQIRNLNMIKRILVPMSHNKDTQNIIQNFMRKNNPFKVISF